MASSKVMPSSSSTSTSTNSDLTHHHHHHHLNHHHLNHNYTPNHPHLNLNHHNYTCTSPPQMIPDETPMSVNSIFETTNSNCLPTEEAVNVNGNCALLDAEITLIDAAGAISAVDCGGEADAAGVRERRTVEDIWREIVAGGKTTSSSGGGGDRRECKAEVVSDEIMTLEDFLARATAGEDEDEDGMVVAAAATGIEDEDVKMDVSPGGIVAGAAGGGLYGFAGAGPAYAVPVQQVPSSGGMAGFGNGGGGGGGGGRGKRSRGSGVMLEPMDKAAQQRQRRMIKNRESAARSRERKQAYQVELEALAAKLEEENDLLLREKAMRTKERYKQLMEKVVPVAEKRRPPRKLRRVRSMQW